jgi:hypothetical protein
VGLTAAAADAVSGAAVAAELRGTRKPSDITDLPLDDDGQHVADPGEAFEQLYAGSEGDLASDTIFEGGDLRYQGIVQL